MRIRRQRLPPLLRAHVLQYGRMAGKRGQPTKLNDEVQNVICAALAAAYPVAVACKMAGISLSSYYDWRQKGAGGGESRWAKFHEATEQAIANSRKVIDDRLASYAGLLENGLLPEPTEWTEETRGGETVTKRTYQPAKFTLILAQARFPEMYAEKREVKVTEAPRPVGPVKLLFADEKS